MCHTPRAYDEAAFRAWLVSEKGRIDMPWDTPNAEHLAVLFTRSIQAIKWRRHDDAKDVVATLCFCEEDRSSSAHAGSFDCFAGRPTLPQEPNASFEATKTGFGRDVDGWFSMAKLCKGLEIPDRRVADVELVNLCRGAKSKYPTLLKRLTERQAADSAAVEFLRSNAGLVGPGQGPKS